MDTQKELNTILNESSLNHDHHSRLANKANFDTTVIKTG